MARFENRGGAKGRLSGVNGLIWMISSGPNPFTIYPDVRRIFRMAVSTLHTPVRLMDFLAEHRDLVFKLGFVWAMFALMEIGKAFYFNGAATPVFYYALFSAYLYMPWFLFSMVCGLAAQKTLDLPLFSKSSLQIHLPIALVVVVLHVLVLTSAYWVFWPERVSRVSFGFVLGEQAVKWAHFEMLAYFILLYVWRRRLTTRSEAVGGPISKGNAEELSLVTDNGMVKLHSEQIECILADDNYVIVHSGNRQHRIRGTLKEMLSQLRGDEFQQTHRSAVVNMNKVKEIGSQRLVLQSGNRIPVSRRRYRQLMEAFSR